MANGANIFTRVDHWHSHGPLVKQYGARLVYDAAKLSPQGKQIDLIYMILSNPMCIGPYVRNRVSDCKILPKKHV